MPNIHPMLVHFPIAILSLSFLCEAAAVLWKREDLSVAGWWTQLAGSIGLAAAAVSGILAGKSGGIPAAAKPYLDSHQEIGFAAAAAFAALLFWRIGAGTKRPPGRDVLFLLLFAAGVIALWTGAWYGGEMVYRFGTGVQPPSVP